MQQMYFVVSLIKNDFSKKLLLVSGKFSSTGSLT